MSFRSGFLWIALGIACLTSVLGGINTFLNTVSDDELCQGRAAGREAVRGAFIANQGTLVRFAGANTIRDYGYTSSEYHKFNERASKYMITVRSDLLQTFPPINC